VASRGPPSERHHPSPPGWSCERVVAALLLDDDTVRDWPPAYEQGDVEGPKSFGHEGSSNHLTDEQAIQSARCQRKIEMCSLTPTR